MEDEEQIARLADTAPTPEQAERKAKFRALVKQVADMQPLERDALAAKMLGVLTVEGRSLSIRNTILIALQMPGATIVGGFRQWIAAGRCVRKGEHGAAILVPCGKKGKDGEQTDTEGDSVFFVTGTVFDIGQTLPLDTIQPTEPTTTTQNERL